MNEDERQRFIRSAAQAALLHQQIMDEAEERQEAIGGDDDTDDFTAEDLSSRID